MAPQPEKPLTTLQAVLVAGAAVACFHLAHSFNHWAIPQLLIVGYVIGLVQLARLGSMRLSFGVSLGAAFLCFAPQSLVFWTLFGMKAIVLWLILAFWIALFVALTHLTLVRFGAKRAAVLIPFMWTGLEYFRCELYYLKFSWLSVGYALTGWDVSLLRFVGMYGIGFLVAAIAGAWLVVRPKLLTTIIAFVLMAGLKFVIPMSAFPSRGADVRVAGIQLEFPKEAQVLEGLDKLIAAQPDANLLVLSEYTFSGPVPDSLKAWCQRNQRYLVLGAEDPVAGRQYFDTAFVVGPTGEVIFRQVKSVPVQFMEDGLPATHQEVWNSPWGKIGFCVCYDLSYAWVTDELIRQGAQLIVVPTMDVAGWGLQEHRTNGRVAPVRAAEYGVPVFRLASSGISEAVDGRGYFIAQAAYPGQGDILAAGFALPKNGTLPPDRWLAPFCVFLVALLMLSHLVLGWTRRKRRRAEEQAHVS